MNLFHISKIQILLLCINSIKYSGIGVRCIQDTPSPIVTSLSCSNTGAGTLTVNIPAAAGVTATIPYSGGNGEFYPQMTIASTGVLGLTATLSAGSLTTSSGTLTFTITGTPESVGTASFPFTFGSKTCSFTRTVTAPSFAAGSGSFSGKMCFDVAISNDNSNSCGPLSARNAIKANFTQSATHTQSYKFTPTGTVSNVRFMYVNTNGNVVTAISGNNTGTNISTPVTATVSFNQTLNGLATGLTNSNPLTADIYVIYNDGATNNGTD